MDVIKIPSWSLPLVVGAFTIAISYGTATAQVVAIEEDLERIERIVEETAEQAVENGTSTKLNEQAIDHIVETLADMEETAKSSDDKLQTLINIMLEQRQ
jgi:hypothetical protein|tara:strand:+ start:59 stop:358 length:300 start_codon:yes stop_codon:yes gene_type:complete